LQQLKESRTIVPMDLAGLAAFVQIVERGSLSAAARATGQSLPTVSRHLRALEAELDAQLALRTTRRLVVTDEGRRLYEHARRALSELDQARSRAGPRADEKLVVSLPVTLGQHLIVPRLPRLLQRRPGLRLEVRLEDRLTELLAENIDVVVRAGVAPPDSAELIGQALCSFHRELAAAPRYLRSRGAPKTPASLAAHDCLVQLAPTGPVDRWRLVRGDREEQVAVAGRLASTAPQVLLDGARAGLGIALLTSWLLAEDIAAGRLRRVLPGWASPPVTVFAVYRRRLRGAPALRAFIEAVSRDDDTASESSPTPTARSSRQ
jgi:DNA-binding transcriptional LysR family regulator